MRSLNEHEVGADFVLIQTSLLLNFLNEGAFLKAVYLLACLVFVCFKSGCKE